MVAPLPNPCKNSLSCASSMHGSRSRSASPKTPLGTSKISSWTLPKIEQARLRFVDSVGRKPMPRLEASMMTQEFSNIELETLEVNDNNGLDLFEGMKHRFLRFKKHQFLENNVHFQNLSQSQAPKFMVIACADSRVCPSNILGFQPGEAFTIRNVANLVPPFENGPTETNAALEFAVNSLEVGNIFVIGHSCCGGIRALMSMPDDVDSGNNSFIRDWVIVGKRAKLSTKAANADLSFEQQCRHCEKESVNRSLLNLLTYPWIEKRVKEGILSLHGGYYDFVNCSFEKWTLDYRGSKDDGVNYTIKDRSFWS